MDENEDMKSSPLKQIEIFFFVEESIQWNYYFHKLISTFEGKVLIRKIFYH